MLDYTDKLEDAVYCSDRTIKNFDDGYEVFAGIEFKNFNSTIDLSCSNELDQFSTSNNKAKLKYPIALLTAEEAAQYSLTTLLNNNNGYWFMSPSRIYSDEARVVSVGYAYGYPYILGGFVTGSTGIRPVITLNKNNRIISGDGTTENPWIIE